MTSFGLIGALTTFQRFVNSVLKEFLDDFCSAYVDDILVYSSGSLQDHKKKVSKVLARLQEAELSLDIDKCEFEKLLNAMMTSGPKPRWKP